MGLNITGKKTLDDYIAPGGKEYGIAAGILTGLDSQSSVLEIGCGFGETACNLAQTFGCQVTAVDVNKHNVAVAREKIRNRSLEERISCIEADVFGLKYPPESFDLIVAEGGALTALGDRKKFLDIASRLLKAKGHLYITDLVVHWYASTRIKEFYKNYSYASEELYKRNLSSSGFKTILCAYLSKNSWENYMSLLKSMLEQGRGMFILPAMREFAIEELDIYYNHGGKQGLDYIYIIASKI